VTNGKEDKGFRSGRKNNEGEDYINEDYVYDGSLVVEE
jgi:hypothetical protein